MIDNEQVRVRGGWCSVAKLDAIEDAYPFQAVVGDQELVICREGDQVFALDNICTHAFARLSDGWCENSQVFCPLHSGSFDFRTGEAVAAPCTEPIKRFPVRIEGDEVMVKL